MGDSLLLRERERERGRGEERERESLKFSFSEPHSRGGRVRQQPLGCLSPLDLCLPPACSRVQNRRVKLRKACCQLPLLQWKKPSVRQKV